MYRTSLAVQWLRLHASNAGGAGSIPSPVTKIPHAMWHGQKKKKVEIFIPWMISLLPIILFSSLNPFAFCPTNGIILTRITLLPTAA